MGEGVGKGVGEGVGEGKGGRIRKGLGEGEVVQFISQKTSFAPLSPQQAPLGHQKVLWPKKNLPSRGKKKG